ncbi:hypothetical protein LWI29_020689 [Acer saccharum]|uniref:Uncharacterized protein n=1 Tax=Acer saccharum TaxID=4024 RepID=A0AA39W7C9_ACESA|nr:hypothetical protein LWI29_020689 [Acer saccharum]KAK1588913.1 hypothetical protein Q3G72_028534 [Acer saccharum]
MEKYFSLISLNQDSVTVVTIQPTPLSSDDFVTAHAFTTLISVHVVFSLSNFSQNIRKGERIFGRSLSCILLIF